MLVQSTEQALHMLKTMLNELSGSQQETLMVFDNLMQDYLFNECKVDVELWRAACFKYGLQEDEEFVAVLEGTCF